MKKQLMSIMVIGIAALFLGAGTFAYFSDTETSVGNTFTAGTIDISLNPEAYDGQQVVTVEGDLDLKPCQTGYTYTDLTNDGLNPCEVWKHVDNVVNEENGIVEPEQEYYNAHADSWTWCISDWIRYDMYVYKSLGYSFTINVDIEGSDYDLVLTVEDGDGWQTWTFDFPVEHFTGDGNLNVGLIIALDGDGNGPAYQIHNNDGADSNYDWGTWLMSPWGPTIGDGWFGWHSGSINTPVADLDWVEATGNRNVPHGDGILQIKIKKSELAGTIHWAASPTVGSGFSGVYDVTMQIPTGFTWSEPIVNMALPNYIEAEISELIKEIPEAEGWFLSDDGPNPHPNNIGYGVECNWIYLGILQPGEMMCVIQSYHLDKDVDNWGQSDKVTFDIEFLAQQIEGDPMPPQPTPVLPGHGRP